MKKILFTLLLVPLLVVMMSVGSASAASYSDQLKKVNKDLKAAEAKYKAAEKKYKATDAKYKKAIITGEIITYTTPKVIMGTIAGDSSSVPTRMQIDNPKYEWQKGNIYTGFHYFKSSSKDASGNPIEIYGAEPAKVATAKKAMNKEKAKVTSLKTKKSEITALKKGAKYKKYINGKYIGKLNSKGQEHGFGTLTLSNGEKFVGNFKNGNMYGKGTYTWKNGDKYVGYVKDRKMNGKGEYYVKKIAKVPNPDGTWSKEYYETVYKGEFKDHKFNGKGTLTHIPAPYYTTLESYKYEGSFKNGKFHGYGVIKDLKTGVIQKGEWANGELVKPDLS